MRSQNGWPLSPRVRRRLVPGTLDVYLSVVDNNAGDLLILVAECWDKFVEDLDWDSTRGELDDWGYANRPIRGGTDASNHASGTALDFNATRHVLGAVNTFSAPQRAVIRSILSACLGAIRWGGDYVGRKDEMHVEINTTSSALIDRAIISLRAWLNARIQPVTENAFMLTFYAKGHLHPAVYVVSTSADKIERRYVETAEYNVVKETAGFKLAIVDQGSLDALPKVEGSK